MRTTFSLATPDGLTLHVYRWAPEHVRGVLQIAHGMAEHAARYERLAEAFVADGWAVYAHDHRGHGKSVPAGERPGHMADDDGWNRAVSDLHRLNRRIASDHPGVPIVMLGHSMGSFMVQQLLSEEPSGMVATVLSGSNGKPPLIASAGRLIARIERLRVGKRGTSALIRKLTFDDFNRRFPGRTGFDWLSRDDAEVDKYCADPLCGFDTTVQCWIDMLDALPRIAAGDNRRRVPNKMPLYVFAGEEDPVGDRGAGVRRLVDEYRAAGLQDITCKIYPGARHEALNETNREEVTSDLLKWCNQAVERATEAAA